MRDYGKVFSQIWESEDFRSLSEDGRALVLYLLTCKHNTIAGVFRLPDGYVCEDLQWTAERVGKGFCELSLKGFATRCETSKWVWVVKFLEWNPPENPNQRKSAAKVAASVPAQCGWKPVFMRVCGVPLGLPQPEKTRPSDNPLATIPQPGTETEVETEVKPPIPPEGGKRAASCAVGFKTWAEAEKAAGRKLISPGDPVFAYAEEVGIPAEFLQLAWAEFRERYSAPESKRYKDWRSVFRKAVRGNWLKLWVADANGYRLSTVGEQAQRAVQSHIRRAA